MIHYIVHERTQATTVLAHATIICVACFMNYVHVIGMSSSTDTSTSTSKPTRKNAKWDQQSRKRLFELRDEYGDLFTGERKINKYTQGVDM